MGFVADLLMERVLSGWLQARMSERKFSPTEIRLSESGTCLRKRALRALGFEGRPLSEEDAATFEEGNLMEDFLAKVLEERYPGRVERQVPVPVKSPGLPPCEGHVDFLLWEERNLVEGGLDSYRLPRIVECKTVNRHSAAFGLPKEEHILQVQAYMHFGRFGPVGVACNKAEIVYFLKGRRLDWRVFPVIYSPTVGLQIEDDLHTLWTYVKDGDIPSIPDGYAHDAYPCYWRTVSEGTEHYCEMYDHCWDREVETATTLAVQVSDLVREYADLRRRHSQLVAEAEEIKERLRPLEEKLAGALGGQSGVLEADGVRVRGTFVRGRITYDVDAAILSGAVSEEALAPFRKEGQGYWRWTVSMRGGSGGAGQG